MILSLGLNLFVKFINLDSEYDIILLNWGCNMSKGKKLFIIILFILLVGGISYLVYLNMVTAPFITSIEKSDDKRFPNKIIINVHVDNYFYKLNKDVWCYITTDKEKPDVNSEDWVMASNGYCNFSVIAGEYEVYVKDKYGNINDIESQDVRIDKVVQIKPEKSTYYLYKGQSDQITYSLVSLGEADESITFSSNNESIVDISEDGKISGKEYGNAVITLKSVDGVKSSVTVYVSPLITKPTVNPNKSYITCKQFSSDEANLIDNMLFDRVDEAGYKTRAGVVAAARFITLEFSYRIHYFYENGRLDNYDPYLHVDGEGRYYHRGMYLHTNKYSYLDKTGVFEGPAIWGCDLRNYTNWGPYVVGKYYPNGLDCSGFVSWALLNGGFDVGYIGAGENANHDDLDDLGEKVYITNELMNSGRVKPGDLIGLNGHMAILAGWDDNNYYIAESLNTTGGVVMTVVPKNQLVGKSIYKYIILMDDVYKEDGNLTTMW